VDLISEIALKEGWCTSSADANERAESGEKLALQRLQQELSTLSELGRPVKFAFNSSSPYLIQGVCFIEPADSVELKDSKKRRLRFTDYLEALTDLSPTQFECLCGKLIRLLGVDDPVVSRRSADEGIDFYGKLRLDSVFFPKDLTPTIQKQLSVWIVGQAKHYQSIQSGTPEIRDLVGAVVLGRAGAFGSIDSPLKELDIRVGDPVFALLVTTGTLSSNAWRLMTRSGVIGMDGEMLAAFLSDRVAGLPSTAFDKASFVCWIES
jgi:restriction endonuclease Mrr